MRLNKLVVFLIFVILFSTIPLSHCKSTASTDPAKNSFIEAIQAGRSYKLAEEEFMHDFGKKVNRQELSMLMIKLLEKLAYKNIGDLAKVLQPLYPYNDKPAPSKTYLPYILMASKLEVVSSSTKNKFTPYGLVTKEFFASVLLKALVLARPLNNYFPKDDVKFADNAKIKLSPRTGLIYAYKKKYITTNSLNAINPRSYVTREQALDIIYKVLVDEKAVLKLSEVEIKRARGEIPLFKIKSNDNKWGYKDSSGKLIILPQYTDAREFAEGLAAVCINGKWGFIDTASNLITKLEYEKVRDFHEGLAAVSSGGKYGYIDNTGKIAIKLQYLCDKEFESDSVDFKRGRATVKLAEQKYRIINKTGKIMERGTHLQSTN